MVERRLPRSLRPAMATSGWHKRREQLRGSLWLMPLLFTVAAMVLGGLLGLIRTGTEGPLSAFLFHGDAEEARRVLLTVAGSSVGVFAIVVGLTLVALQVASSRYSPRLLREFLRDRPTQMVQSLFIATFAYNAAGLFTVSGDAKGDYPRLAVTVGIGMLLVCIAALVYYVDRVVHSIQIHTILVGIGIAATRAINAEPPGIGRASGQSPAPDPPDHAVPLTARHSGYVQYIQPKQLLPIATSEDLVIRFAPAIGDHVVEGTTIGWAWRASPAERPPRPGLLADAMEGSITLGRARSSQFDVALGIVQAVDIALLSMHVFDYHTVAQAADEIAVVLSKIADRPLGTETIKDAAGSDRIVVPGLDFAGYLDLACGEIRRRGASEPVIARALVAMLRAAGGAAGPGRADAVREQIELVRSSAERAIAEPHDVDLVRAEIDRALHTLTAAQPASG